MNKLTKILLVIGGMQAVYNDGILNKNYSNQPCFMLPFFTTRIKDTEKLTRRNGMILEVMEKNVFTGQSAVEEPVTLGCLN